jgi:hypothetical protein
MSDRIRERSPDKAKRHTTKLLLLAAAAALTLPACDAVETAKKIVKGPSPTNTPIPTPLPGSVPAILNETATVAAQNPDRSSFVPEGKFTQEFFEKVRQSVFAIDSVLEDGNSASGTAFCVKKEKNDKGGFNLYFASCEHVILPIKEDASPRRTLDFWRPGIDPQRIFGRNIKAVVSEENDLVVFKCEADADQAENIVPLAVRDYALTEVTDGKKLLVVGFPIEFKNVHGINLLTSAQIVTVRGEAGSDGEWSAEGVADIGNSGSPAVEPDENGNPLVVAIVAGRSSDSSVKSVSGFLLNVHSMIETVDKMN